MKICIGRQTILYKWNPEQFGFSGYLNPGTMGIVCPAWRTMGIFRLAWGTIPVVPGSGTIVLPRYNGKKIVIVLPAEIRMLSLPPCPQAKENCSALRPHYSTFWVHYPARGML